MECVIDDLSLEIIKERIKRDDILLDVLGGIAKLNVDKIPILEGVLIN